MLKTFLRKSHIQLAVITFFFFMLCANITLAARYVSVNGDNVNVRTGPGTNYQVRMELFDGYPLQVVANQGDWLKIRDFENDEGWIHTSLVKPGNTVIINASSIANMRSEPTTNSTVVAEISRGVVLTKLDSRGQWYKLKHAGGTIGWIYGPLLWPR